MEEFEKLKNWLMTYPGWVGELPVDHTGGRPGDVGLYCLGRQQLRRTEDVLGGVKIRCRDKFALRRMVAAGEDNAQAAAWLLDFQSWVQQQSQAGLAPTFGHEPATERIRAEQGRLIRRAQPGTGLYEVTITAEYTKVYAAA